MLYDKRKSAAHLVALREELGDKLGKDIKGTDLSKLISEKMNFDVRSHTLLKYENPDIEETMSLDCLMVLSKFYNVSYDYILGLSESRQYKTDSIVRDYGLSDHALQVLQNLNLQKDTKKEGNTLPSDLDIINALFENTEFPDLIDSIRQAIILKENAVGTDYSKGLEEQRQIIDSFSADQLDAVKANKLVLLNPRHAYTFYEFDLQKRVLSMVYEISDDLR